MFHNYLIAVKSQAKDKKLHNLFIHLTLINNLHIIITRTLEPLELLLRQQLLPSTFPDLAHTLETNLVTISIITQSSMVTIITHTMNC